MSIVFYSCGESFISHYLFFITLLYLFIYSLWLSLSSQKVVPDKVHCMTDITNLQRLIFWMGSKHDMQDLFIVQQWTPFMLWRETHGQFIISPKVSLQNSCEIQIHYLGAQKQSTVTKVWTWYIKFISFSIKNIHYLTYCWMFLFNFHKNLKSSVFLIITCVSFSS